jgi:small subunit ribosomal protein S9
MTEEEKTEDTPQPEDAGNGEEVADLAQQDGNDDGGAEPAVAAGEAEEEAAAVDQTPPPAHSDHDLMPAEPTEDGAGEPDEGPDEPDEGPDELAEGADELAEGPDEPTEGGAGEPTEGGAGEQTEGGAGEQTEGGAGEQTEVADEPDDSQPEPPASTELPPEPSKPEEKKVDLIPGADLEPIAVEPEAPQLSAEEQARLEAEEEERARREAELVGEAEEPGAASRAPAQMESGARYLATGKRKNAIARVTLTPGDGKFEVNKRALEEFFPRPLHQTMARQSLVAAGYEGSVDVRVLVHGGGISGQAGAVRHGIARALTEIDPELRSDLKRRGFLTRDARVKERRKAGLKKARKRPQFSKR